MLAHCCFCCYFCYYSWNVVIRIVYAYFMNVLNKFRKSLFDHSVVSRSSLHSNFLFFLSSLSLSLFLFLFSSSHLHLIKIWNQLVEQWINRERLQIPLLLNSTVCFFSLSLFRLFFFYMQTLSFYLVLVLVLSYVCRLMIGFLQAKQELLKKTQQFLFDCDFNQLQKQHKLGYWCLT